MLNRRSYRSLLPLLLVAIGLPGCTDYPWLNIGGNGGGTNKSNTGNAFGTNPFTDNVIQARTFVNGTAVTTVTYAIDDMRRVPRGIDFNADGKIDPVVVYGPDRDTGATQAVIQILLSDGPLGTVKFVSLTLDSKHDWARLADVAVGDIDGDGFLDIVAASERGVVYLHHPSGGDTTALDKWGNEDGSLEYLANSTDQITKDELTAILAQAVGPGVNLDDYDVTVDQGYTNVEIADFDNDGDNDVAASRRLNIMLNPKPGLNIPPLQIIDGVVQVFVNPGFAQDGANWTLVDVGQHERHAELDRDGASGLLAYDMDGDGRLDIVSAARQDNNVQVAWFRNPGVLDPLRAWKFWRVGSVRDAISIDVADLTGDGKPDVVATGGTQKQVMLFVQPAEGPKRSYDWDSYAIVTFDQYEPRGVLAIDIDNDGRLECVVGCTNGAVRYFEPGKDVTKPWTAVKVLDYDPPGDVGLIGYGDLDNDGDLDLICVIDNQDDGSENSDRVTWIRNETSPLPAGSVH